MDMHDFLPILTIIIIVALLWVRSAFTSLNKDMRTILDRQADMRARLEALEARVPSGAIRNCGSRTDD